MGSVGTEQFEWAFDDTSLREALKSGADRAVMRRLEAGRQRFFRLLWMWKLGPAGAVALLALAAAAAIYLAWEGIDDLLGSHLPVWPVLAGLGVVLLLAISYAANPRAQVVRAAAGAPMRTALLLLGVLGAIAAPIFFACVLAAELLRRPFGRRWVRL